MPWRQSKATWTASAETPRCTPLRHHRQRSQVKLVVVIPVISSQMCFSIAVLKHLHLRMITGLEAGQSWDCQLAATWTKIGIFCLSMYYTKQIALHLSCLSLHSVVIHDLCVVMPYFSIKIHWWTSVVTFLTLCCFRFSLPNFCAIQKTVAKHTTNINNGSQLYFICILTIFLHES